MNEIKYNQEKLGSLMIDMVFMVLKNNVKRYFIQTIHISMQFSSLNFRSAHSNNR